METAPPRPEDQTVQRFLASPGEGTFAMLFRVVAPRLLRYFRARGCEPALAEDLTQEVMISVYKHHDALRDASLFQPWVFRIARNTLLQYLRGQTRQVATITRNP